MAGKTTTINNDRIPLALKVWNFKADTESNKIRYIDRSTGLPSGKIKTEAKNKPIDHSVKS